MEGLYTLPYLGGFTMRKIKQYGIAAFVGLTTLASNAMAAGYVTPTPDYTDFNAVVGVGLGVTLIVALAYKAKGFLS